MDPALIFEPVINMFWLTLAVFLFSFLMRHKSILIDKTSKADDYKIPVFNEGGELIQNAQRNLTNLFEFPVLFYAVCLVIFVTGSVDEHFIDLAFYYFWIRVAHSLCHIFYNKIIPGIAIPVRSLLWVPSTLIIFWMALRLSSIIF